jgi:lysophospholipase L1-like esterase
MLALGDSLAAGYQPTDGRNPPPVDPATGWPDQGYPHGYASDLAAAEHLELIDLGCPGETTTSYTTVPAQPECEKVYSGELGASNQQAAALAVLAAHLHEVRLVTFDLGANDLDACLSGTTVDAGCLFARSSAVLARLPHLLATIRAALERDDPGARLAAMDYYDPFLGLAEDPGGLKGTALATLSVGVLETFDASLRAIYAHAGAVVVDVSSAFQTGAVLPLTGYDGKQLPRDVALVCRWTYMCPAPGTSGATASPDIHPNDAGYARIAAAFQAALAPR